MQLIITKDNSYLELEDNVNIRPNEFGVYFWDNFYYIDPVRVIKDKSKINLNSYSKVFEDFKGEIKQKGTQATICMF